MAQSAAGGLLNQVDEVKSATTVEKVLDPIRNTAVPSASATYLREPSGGVSLFPHPAAIYSGGNADMMELRRREEASVLWHLFNTLSKLLLSVCESKGVSSHAGARRLGSRSSPCKQHIEESSPVPARKGLGRLTGRALGCVAGSRRGWMR